MLQHIVVEGTGRLEVLRLQWILRGFDGLGRSYKQETETGIKSESGDPHTSHYHVSHLALVSRNSGTGQPEGQAALPQNVKIIMHLPKFSLNTQPEFSTGAGIASI